MGASMRITTAYLNSSQVDAMQPRQPATQYEHKKKHILHHSSTIKCICLCVISRLVLALPPYNRILSCQLFLFFLRSFRFVLFLVDEIQWSFQGKLNCSSAGGLNHFTTLSNLFISLDINAAKMTFFRSAT